MNENNLKNLIGQDQDKNYWKERALKAEKRISNLDLVLVCAKDIVNAWPGLTIRMLGSMTNRIDTLKQALQEVM